MSIIKTYQISDSSVLNNSFVKEKQNLSDSLNLLNEKGSSLGSSNVKNIHYQIKADTTTHQLDTFYGIKNVSEIPIWNTELKKTKEKPLEKLFNPTPKITSVESWQIIVLVLAIVLLGLAKAFSSNRFKQSIKALFKYSIAQEITREEKVLLHRSNILFTLIHLLTTALFFYQLQEVFNSTNLEISNELVFLFLLGIIITLYLIKYIFSKVLFFILDDTSIATEYIFNTSLFNNLLGVIFIPILCIIYFSSLPFSVVLYYLVVPLVLAIFLLRLMRLYAIGISKGISYYYIFLYICTLEILPLVGLFRIFILK